MKLILPYAIADRIEPHLPADVAVVHIDQAGVADGNLADADAFLRWWLPNATYRQVVEAAAGLRWMHTPSAGVDSLLIPAMLNRQIVMTNSAGAHAIPIAEFVLMFLLSHVKRVRELAALTAETTWPVGRDMRLNELYVKTILILGMGQIGQEVARRCAGFGMRVFGSRRHPAPLPGVAHVVGEQAWRELLPQTDYLVVATPLTSATRAMVDASAFASLKHGAYLVNIARGEIVDTDALLAALHTGQLAGAALDALPEEPLPPGHPLWQAPNVWITPHISWSSPETMPRALDLFFENLRRYRANEPLLNVVDKAAGY